MSIFLQHNYDENERQLVNYIRITCANALRHQNTDLEKALYINIDYLPLDLVSSINDFENIQQNAEVNIYPNPSNGVFSVNLPTDTIVSIIVYNVQGSKVYTDDNILLHQYTLNLTDFPQGNYIVAVQSHDKTYSSKISKK